MPTDGRQPDQTLTDAAWNACAVASIAHREAVDAADRAEALLASMLDSATTYGMTIDDMCRATGLDREYVVNLLVQVDERRAS